MRRLAFFALVLIALAILLLFWAWHDYTAVVAAHCPQLMR